MAWNKHLHDADYRRCAQDIIDNTEWHQLDLADVAFDIVSKRLDHLPNEAELGEIWTHVISINDHYIILCGPEVEDKFLTFGTDVVYDEPEKEDTPDAEAACGST